MAVLEGYSLRECSAMLGCSDQDVITAKTSALARLGKHQPSAADHEDAPWAALTARAQVA